MSQLAELTSISGQTDPLSPRERVRVRGPPWTPSIGKTPQKALARALGVIHPLADAIQDVLLGRLRGAALRKRVEEVDRLAEGVSKRSAIATFFEMGLDLPSGGRIETSVEVIGKAGSDVTMRKVDFRGS